jgi:DNA-damage-inducible protein D
MADLSLVPNQSPFDKIRRVRPDGSEYWTARDMQPLMAYVEWRNFSETVIGRARASAANTGIDTDSEFRQVVGVVQSDNPSGSERKDYELGRHAAYLVAMNGDPNKPEVAAAQAYFAVKARQAELAIPQTREERFALAVAEAKEMLAEKQNELDRANHALGQAKPLALMAMNFMDTGETLSTKEVALILQGDPAIMNAVHGRARTRGIGEGRLFRYMYEVLGWTQELYYYGHLPPVKYWAPRQDHNKVQVDLRPRDPRMDDNTGKWRQLPPQLRITRRGFFELWRLLGGTGEPTWPFD